MVAGNLREVARSKFLLLCRAIYNENVAYNGGILCVLVLLIIILADGPCSMIQFT